MKEKTFVNRELKLDHAFLYKTGKIAAIIGPRRAGKSFYLFQIRKTLDISIDKTVWIDFSSWLIDSFH